MPRLRKCKLSKRRQKELVAGIEEAVKALNKNAKAAVKGGMTVALMVEEPEEFDGSYIPRFSVQFEGGRL